MVKKLIPVILAAGLMSGSAAPSPDDRQIRAMETVLQQADEAYYNRHRSELSDAAYDALRSRYDLLRAGQPESSGQTAVDAPVGKSVRRAEHSVPILSLDKVYSDEGVTRFLQKAGTHLRYCVEPKIDGLTVVLQYRNGRLTRALTRGDGKTGADITSAVLASGFVPAILTQAPARLDVRGEAFLTFSAFDDLNRRRTEDGTEPLKNPRNAASGTLMLSDPAEIAARNLQFVCFDLLAADVMPDTHTAALMLLEQAGLPVIESRTLPSEKILSAAEELNRRRAEFPFPTDGLVIKVDDLQIRSRLGATARHPRSAIARKYEETPVKTRLLGVEWSQAESGKLTPVALFEPVEIQGAKIQRATLHNIDYIQSMDLKTGDWIHVIRSGGSVPEIIGVCRELRTGQEKEIHAPRE